MAFCGVIMVFTSLDTLIELSEEISPLIEWVHIDRQSLLKLKQDKFLQGYLEIYLFKGRPVDMDIRNINWALKKMKLPQLVA